jgi:asparagine synthase (glutamine-hydrolysing)
VFGTLGRWYPKLDWAPRVFRGQATFKALSRGSVEGYFYSVSGIKPDIKTQILAKDFAASLNGYSPLAMFEHFYNRPVAADHLSRLQYLDIKTYLVDDILVKVDRASMANSLEVRCPILDHKFMEVVARMPSSLKLRGRAGKYILKRALDTVLPRDVLTRRKQGFAVPLAQWFRKELRAFTADLILRDDPLRVLEPKGVNYLWTQHLSGLRDYSTPLWGILMYRKWQERYLAERQ